MTQEGNIIFQYILIITHFQNLYVFVFQDTSHSQIT